MEAFNTILEKIKDGEQNRHTLDKYWDYLYFREKERKKSKIAEKVDK